MASGGVIEVLRLCKIAFFPSFQSNRSVRFVHRIRSKGHVGCVDSNWEELLSKPGRSNRSCQHTYQIEILPPF